jgi:hypothetical protein
MIRPTGYTVDETTISRYCPLKLRYLYGNMRNTNKQQIFLYLDRDESSEVLKSSISKSVISPASIEPG